MRKGIDSLAGVVTNELGKNPLTGDLFIFTNRRKNQLKMLHWQGDGYALFCKRLEKGTYELPANNQITSEQVLFLLQGVVLKSVEKHKRYSHCFVSN
jgi:transposase